MTFLAGVFAATLFNIAQVRIVGGGGLPSGCSNDQVAVYNSTTGLWACGSAGGGTPGGADTQVQFNDAGAFGGDSGLTYDKTSDVLTVKRVDGTTANGLALTVPEGATNRQLFLSAGIGGSGETGGTVSINGGGTNSGAGGAVNIVGGEGLGDTGGSVSLSAGGSVGGAVGNVSVTVDGATWTYSKAASLAMLAFPPTTFANLGTPDNGAFVYCSDCTIANPCAGSSTGAFAKRLNGVWVCN